MKIVATSDIHGRIPWNELVETIPSCDVLIIAGDLLPNHYRDGTMDAYWQLNQLDQFNRAARKIRAGKILLVPGNHDWVFEAGLHREIVSPAYTSLLDESITVDGVTFYGTPWVPAFCDWAFNVEKDSDLMQRLRDKIAPCDVLITHGPAYGILDTTIDGRNVGCRKLRERIRRITPKVHIHGDIHESFGTLDYGETSHYNVSMVDVNYQPINPVVEINLDTK